MSRNRLKSSSGTVPGTATIALLLLLVLSAGCAEKAVSRAEAERKFLAPTDVNKLTPEARAHLPGGGKFQPTGP
jgi:hypothetical protein